MNSSPTVRRADLRRRRTVALVGATALLLTLGPVTAAQAAPTAAQPLAQPLAAPLAPPLAQTASATGVLPMGIGRQKSSSTTLRAFLKWADGYGFRVSEHPSYGGVTRGAHTTNSWHYDGLAGDLNWGPPGTSSTEKSRLRFAIRVADSMGLGVIHARDGVVGSAGSHRSHLHVDVGTTSNYGRGLVPAKSGSRTTQRLQYVVHFPLAQRDNLWGTNTDQRLNAVRAASRMHGTKFPYGVRTAQRAVGVTADGKWGPRSRAAHDRTVSEIQRVLGVSQTATWGPVTERIYLSVRARLH